VAVGFAIIRVIAGVFLIETFRTAASDDELMVVQKRRTQTRHARKMARLLREADESNDGFLQRDELKKVLSNHDVKTWLGAQELDVDDVDLLFDLLDDGDGAITMAELTKGVARLKGAAKSIDVHALMYLTTAIHAQINELISLHDPSKAGSFLMKKTHTHGVTPKEIISQLDELTFYC